MPSSRCAPKLKKQNPRKWKIKILNVKKLIRSKKQPLGCFLLSKITKSGSVFGEKTCALWQKGYLQT